VLGGGYQGGRAEIGTGLLLGSAKNRNKLAVMWTWLVFVVSSAGWVHFVVETARHWKLGTGCAAGPSER
jgi:hypothetical protein